MSRSQSVAEWIAELEAQIEHFRKEEALHAEREAFHREQRAVAAQELANVLERYEAFKGAVDAAGELVGRIPALRKPKTAPVRQEEDLGPGRPILSRLVTRVVEERPPGEVFGATAIAEEVERRFGKRLKRGVDVRSVGVKLRRLYLAGEIQQAHKGTAFHESLYTRPPEAGQET